MWSLGWAKGDSQIIIIIIIKTLFQEGNTISTKLNKLYFPSFREMD